MVRRYTREEFYRLVWSKPMTHLAKEFYISDVALHKICRKHDIPNPPLGWWAKKEAGKPVKQTPLPKATTGTPTDIIIANADLSGEPEKLSAVREQARILASSGGDADDGPHNPIIARTLAALRKANNLEKGLVSVSDPGLIRCTVAPASIDRLALGLSRIVRAVDLQGYQLIDDGGRVRFASEAQSIGFSVTETFKREPHVLTPSERKEQEAFEKRRERARKRPWSDNWEMPSRFQEWDYHPTGQLAIELEQVWGDVRPRSTFRDGKVQRFETMASDFAVGLAVLAAAKTEAQLKQDQKARQRQEERDRRDRQLRSQHIQERRATALGSVLDELEKLDRARRLVTALQAHLADSESERISNFVAWANIWLADLEAGVSAAGLDTRFEDARIFGADDDFEFVSPPYYGY